MRFIDSKCPRCNSKRIVPILYGEPTYEAITLAEKGELEIGGCVVSDDDPKQHCTRCGKDF
jgi:hypothetical protein